MPDSATRQRDDQPTRPNGPGGRDFRCPLCDRPAAIIKEVRGPAGSVYRLLVLCQSCSAYHLTRSAEWVLRKGPAGRAILADRARRIFESTGEPTEIDVQAIEGVADFFR